MKKIIIFLLMLSVNFSVAQTVVSDSTNGKSVLTTTLKSRTFMKKQPTESSSIIEVIPKGTEVNIVELIGDKYYRKVKYNNQIGFVEKSRCQEDMALFIQETKFVEESLKNKIKEKSQSQLFVIPDSLKILYSDSLKFLYIESRIDNIELHLAKAHKDYKTGTALIATGSILSAVTSVFYVIKNNQIDDKSNKKDIKGQNRYTSKEIKNMRANLNLITFSSYGLSSLSLLIGLTIQIDSHRHIGYAGGLK